jgi:hypothetical protein
VDAHLQLAPFCVQPDPERALYVQPKAQKLMRLDVSGYYIVRSTPEGRQVATRLSGANLGVLDFKPVRI